MSAQHVKRSESVSNQPIRYNEYQAVKDGDIRILRRIIEQESYGINSTRWSGWSLLHRAAETGKTEICKLLLEKGALINIRTTWGWHTPLHLALSNGWSETALYLVSQGADQSLKNKYKLTPTAYAQHRGFHATVREFNAEFLKRQFMSEK
jgi:ankyrin repeat protein